MNYQDKKLDDIKEDIHSRNINIDINDGDTLKISCESTVHKNDQKIREGNNVYILFTNEEDEWDIMKVICSNCTIKDEINKYSNSELEIAIIEANVRYDLSSETIYFVEPEIWDVVE